MGAYSTMSITREDAMKEILSRVVSASDEMLEDLLFDLIGNKTLYNFRIVGEYTNDDGALEYSQHPGFRYLD